MPPKLIYLSWFGFNVVDWNLTSLSSCSRGCWGRLPPPFCDHLESLDFPYKCWMAIRSSSGSVLWWLTLLEYQGNMTDPWTDECPSPSECPNSCKATARRLLAAESTYFTLVIYSRIFNNSTGTMEKKPSKISCGTHFFAVLLPIIQKFELLHWNNGLKWSKEFIYRLIAVRKL